MKNGDKFLRYAVWSVITVVLIGFCYHRASTLVTMNVIKDSCIINECRIELYNDKGYRSFAINDSSQLARINIALQSIKQVDKLTGKVFDVWSHIYIKKCNHNIDFWIQYSDGYGWSIEIGGDVYTNAYLIEMIKSYN